MVATQTYNKHQVYKIIENYHWMVKEIQSLGEELQDTDFSGVAQYGTEAAMPTGSGLVSKALENEVIRRDTKYERRNDYINKITFICINLHKITDDKEKAVFDYLLDGWSVSAISRRLGLHWNSVDKIKADIVDRLVGI